MPTPESQQLRNEWYRAMNYCPGHNAFHAQHCLKCRQGLLIQFQREADFIQEIYRIERET